MSWWQSILLGALQGVTEFLPISSSGHLVLAQHYLGFAKEGHAPGAALFFDGMLHLGTVVAVLLYFRRGLRQQLEQHLRQPAVPSTGDSDAIWPAPRRDLVYLAMLVVIASIPAAIVAVVRSKEIEKSFEAPRPVAVNFLILGGVLILTEVLRRGARQGGTIG